jgi:DNA integrity scanning protein DisA with diadenylate cyclase activity
MNASKIVLPKEVAAAIAHYVSLADTKTEALTDILSMGYEATRSEIILRHFDGNQDELMQALICGYEVEKSPEEKVREFYTEIQENRETLRGYIGFDSRAMERYIVMGITVKKTLDLLGIKIDGVNA